MKLKKRERLRKEIMMKDQMYIWRKCHVVRLAMNPESKINLKKVWKSYVTFDYQKIVRETCPEVLTTLVLTGTFCSEQSKRILKSMKFKAIENKIRSQFFYSL
jgi:hypothetical protein